MRFLPVEHIGHSVASHEEAAAVAAEIDRLLGTPYTDGHGERALRPDDFIVVAPYNAHVRRLREAIPDERIRIGTVDKFQGQQATVVFFSMASSSGEDVSRGLEFLFSRHRLNVAVSRARCLAYVVANPRLLEASCRTVEQMKLANALCRFVELAETGGIAAGWRMARFAQNRRLADCRTAATPRWLQGGACHCGCVTTRTPSPEPRKPRSPTARPHTIRQRPARAGKPGRLRRRFELKVEFRTRRPYCRDCRCSRASSGRYPSSTSEARSDQ